MGITKVVRSPSVVLVETEEKLTPAQQAGIYQEFARRLTEPDQLHQDIIKGPTGEKRWGYIIGPNGVVLEIEGHPVAMGQFLDVSSWALGIDTGRNTRLLWMRDNGEVWSTTHASLRNALTNTDRWVVSATLLHPMRIDAGVSAFGDLRPAGEVEIIKGGEEVLLSLTHDPPPHGRLREKGEVLTRQCSKARRVDLYAYLHSKPINI